MNKTEPQVDQGLVGWCLVAKSCLTAASRVIASQASLCLGFPKHEYWSGLPFPSPGDLPDPGMEPVSPVRHGDSSLLHHLVSPLVELKPRTE